MSINIYYQDNVLTLLSKDEYHNECNTMFVTEENLSSQTTKLAQKVQNCKQTFAVCYSITQTLASLVSHFRVIEAAGGVVTDQQGRLLMIFRRGKWDMPKGKRERGEELSVCALREVGEECGIALQDLTLQEKAAISYHIYHDPYNGGELVIKPTHWWFMLYSGNENLLPQNEEDIEQALWLDKKEVATRLDQTHKTLQDIINDKYLNHD